MKPLFLGVAAAFALSASASAAIVSTLPKGAQDYPPEMCLEVAIGTRDPLLVQTYFGIWADRHEALDNEQIGNVLKVLSKGLDPQDAAQCIASSRKCESLIQTFLKIPKTRAIATQALALRATMTMLDKIKLADLEATAPEGNWRAEYERRAGGRGNGKAPNKRWPVSIDTMIELMGDRNQAIREHALIAAASFGWRDATLAQAIQDYEGEDGIVPAAKLLYLARRQSEFSDALVEAAFAARKQPRPIPKDHPMLVTSDVHIPAAAMACLALGIAKSTQHLDRLHKALEDRDIRVRIEAARAITAIADEASLPVVIELLKTEDWAVLIEACRYLAMVPHRDAIKPLIERLEQEDGRFRRDIIYALSSIAGNQYGRQTVEEWEGWFQQAESSGWQLSHDESLAYRNKYRLQNVSLNGYGDFYGLSITSSRFSFVLDSSVSMKTGDRIKDMTDNTIAALTALPRHVYYNLVDFGGTISVMKEKGLTNDKRAAQRTIESMVLSIGTRSYDALEVAFKLEGVDSIYFLSDGSPVRSRVPNWHEIMAATSLALRYRPLAIHTICFQAGENNAIAVLQYANENFGETSNFD